MRIKPCPFCKSVNVELGGLSSSSGFSYMRCPDCEATGPNAETAEEAVKLWNAVSEQVIYSPPKGVEFYVDVPDPQGTWVPVDLNLTWEEAVALVKKMGGDDRGRVNLITVGVKDE